MVNYYSCLLGVNVDMKTSKVNEAGLKIWVFLADRLVRLTASYKRITDLPISGSENNASQNLGSDLTTMYVFCLAPIFLAGNCANFPSVGCFFF